MSKRPSYMQRNRICIASFYRFNLDIDYNIVRVEILVNETTFNLAELGTSNKIKFGFGYVFLSFRNLYLLM